HQHHEEHELLVLKKSFCKFNQATFSALIIFSLRLRYGCTIGNDHFFQGCRHAIQCDNHHHTDDKQSHQTDNHQHVSIGTSRTTTSSTATSSRFLRQFLLLRLNIRNDISNIIVRQMRVRRHHRSILCFQCDSLLIPRSEEHTSELQSRENL